jgi:hypothetical protein
VEQLLYAIEGFLPRLSLSGYREQLVLKGAMLLAVLDARRTTKDADLSAHGIPNAGSVSGCVVERFEQPDVGEVLRPAGGALHLQ